MRSKMVSRQNLNKIAIEMGFDKMILLHHKAIPTRKHIYGNALEAFIGAIYVDLGFKNARQFIIKKILRPYYDLHRLACEDSDFKSQIIQWGQKNKQEVSFESYEITHSGKTHPVFISKIHIMDMLAGEGLGATKKEAQQLAARHALQNLPS
jgi:ribonuclease III